ncbi:hypothetical protein AB0F17_61900 [Nonomuraea sp. NPDC026600]|uniref:hypothetical protein n=1 Tax=Nonomuraea sp. NPDC026600 TaxID=3155363 RepID=UPI0033C6C368
MIDRDRPNDPENHLVLSAEDDAEPSVAQFQPNQTSQRIIARLEKAGFVVRVPLAPYGQSWRLILDNPDPRWAGALHVSKQKGRALQIALTWQAPGQPRMTRKAERAHAIYGLLNRITSNGWKIDHA